MPKQLNGLEMKGWNIATLYKRKIEGYKNMNCRRINCYLYLAVSLQSFHNIRSEKVKIFQCSLNIPRSNLSLSLYFQGLSKCLKDFLPCHSVETWNYFYTKRVFLHWGTVYRLHKEVRVKIKLVTFTVGFLNSNNRCVDQFYAHFRCPLPSLVSRFCY